MKNIDSLKIIRRSGQEMNYERGKIITAVSKANDEFPQDPDRLTENQIKEIADNVEDYLLNLSYSAPVEDIQDKVIKEIMKAGAYNVAIAYTEYRYLHSINRTESTLDKNILSIVDYENENIKQENSNKNPQVASVQRDYVSGEISKDISKRLLLPKDIIEAHEAGLIHFHDLDYFLERIYNCCLVNMEDMLQNGTVISETGIDRPKSFSTACNIATQVIAQVASSQYGGQSISLAHLAPFVDISRKKFRQQVRKEFDLAGIEVTDDKVNEITEMRVKEEINRGVQMIQYQVITLMTTNGQAPFVTVFMYLDEAPEGQEREDLASIIEEMLHQRIKGVKNEKGVFVTPAFPKLIYVLDEDNAYEGSKYFYLTRLAAECTAKRLVPDYISAKVMRENKGGDVYPCMGCRSFLTPDRFSEIKGNISKAKNFKEGKHKYYGRFNQGVVTINLVDVACSSYKDMDKFWEILDERLELCHRALQCRHKRLLGTPADIAPILFRYGAIARLGKGEVIDPLLFDGYSTISLGYAGISEMCYYMTGLSHTSPEGQKFALAVMQKLNDKCAEWKKAENIDYSVYGTPIESTTYKFAKCLKKRFGEIPGVTDKNYITNSYHCNVREKISAFDKLTFESKFQKLSPGGAISYVEVPDMTGNIDAVIAIIQHIYENIMYAELNSKSDYCMNCGYDGEIKIVEDKSGKLVWECPNCGNRDQDKMSVARRTCGYIGTQFWNQGRTQEIRERVLHVDFHSNEDI